MLGNSCSTCATNEKKIALISSTTNQWLPHNHDHIDDQNTYMDSNPSTVRVMEKPGPELVQLQRKQLKCPRCDSSNTKFCYYNNYSLSQPRHFCKACKRYWTRGGTLRNVPVGGGCRKNKRFKRPISGSDCVSSSTTTNSSNLPNLQKTQFDLTSESNHMISPLFFGFPTNPSDLTLPFSGFDLQPQLNGVFSSGLISNDGDYNQNGFSNGTKQIQQDNILGSNSSLFSSATMASVLASKFTNGSRGANIDNILQSYEEDVRNTTSNESEMNMRKKDVKLEDAKTRLEWNVNFANNCQSQNELVGIISNPSLYWNATSVGSYWLDPAPNSIGSSVQLL